MVVRRMEEVTVNTTTEGMIEIEQPAGHDEPSRIILTPEQVPILVKWLQEAAAEIEG